MTRWRLAKNSYPSWGTQIGERRISSCWWSRAEIKAGREWTDLYDLMGSADEIHVVSLKEPRDHIGTKLDEGGKRPSERG